VTKILSEILGWLLRHGFLLLLILACLFAWALFADEWRSVERLQRDREVRVLERGLLEAEIRKLNREATERSRLIQQNTVLDLDRMQAERQELWDGHPWARYVPLSETWKRIKLLDALIASYQKVLEGARSSESAERARASQKEWALAQTNRQIEEVDKELAKSPLGRLESFIHRELPKALAILAGIIFLPFATKIFFYFVIAPLAANRAPIRLLPSTSGRIGSPLRDGVAENASGKASAVSIPIVLGENQELLIRPEYLQSSSLQSRKTTRWFLNSRIPFTSLASGMCMLTRIGPAGSEAVVISAKRDPLSEVGIVELADGAAFVCQPRALAGVVQDREKPVRITRHWRLGSLQAWLTLQLRFLVFHGPGQLVMKGCRGIRIEQAGKARAINQAATLGFGANVSYGNTRCETFMSYWAGKEDLFNDLFAGESGVYVYEEMPDLKRATGVGRHLERFADAVLNAFGV
jgi:hypothetical protein